MSNMNLRAEAFFCAPRMSLNGGSLAVNAVAVNTIAMNTIFGHTTPAAPRGA